MVTSGADVNRQNDVSTKAFGSVFCLICYVVKIHTEIDGDDDDTFLMEGKLNDVTESKAVVVIMLGYFFILYRCCRSDGLFALC